jgi:RsiW-degrading membrane proteinase PrsW (M82 family)
MHLLFLILAGAAAIVAVVCWFIILIDAFQDEVWKGIVCLFCGLYMLYYGVIEYESDNKWLVVIMAFGGGSIAAGLARMALAR